MSLVGDPVRAQTRTARAAFEVRVEVVHRCDVEGSRPPPAECKASVHDRLVARQGDPGRPQGIRETEETPPPADASQAVPAALIRVRTITF